MTEIEVIDFIIDDNRFENEVTTTYRSISGVYKNNSINKELMDEIGTTTGHDFYFMKNREGEGFTIHFERKGRG